MDATPTTPPRSPYDFLTPFAPTPEPGSPKETTSPHPHTPPSATLQISPQSANSPMFWSPAPPSPIMTSSPRVTFGDISFPQPDDDYDDDGGGVDGKTPSRPESKTIKTVIRRKSIQIENLFAYEKDSNLHRDEWLHSYDFNLASLLYATGLGNIRDFPLNLIEGGGAAFLLPYFVMCFLMLCPVLMLEMAMGQFTSRGPTHCWEFARMFTGVGYGMVMICFVTTSGYAATVGVVFEYLVETVTLEMRWGSDHMMHQEKSGAGNSSNVTTMAPSVFHGAEKMYLAHGGQFGEYGINWHWMLSVIASNLLAVASLAFGKKVAARMTYIGAFLTYAPMTAALIFSLQLPGASEGVSHFMKPNTTKLLDSDVWVSAAKQSFYSLGLSFGVYHALASYNNFHQNTLNNALYVIVGDTMFSIMASCLVFSLFGYISQESGIADLDDILRGKKYHTLFVMIPAAFSYHPNAQLWCIVFFCSAFGAGWTSLLMFINTLMTAALDIFKLGMDRQKLVATVTFLVISATAVPICSKRGYHIFQNVISDYIYTLTLSPMLLMEVLAVSRVYGTVTFISDIELMVGWGVSCLLDRRTAKLIWGTIWGVLNPVLSCGIIVLETLTLSDIYKAEEPVWANVVGILGIVSVYMLILGNIVALMLFAANGSCKERARTLLTPSSEWGPAKPYLRHMWETLRKEPSSYEPFTFTGYLLPLVMSYVPDCCKKCFGFRCLNNKPPPPRWKEKGHFRPPPSHNVTMTWSKLSVWEP